LKADNKLTTPIGYKYDWQEEWYNIKDETLEQLTSVIPDSEQQMSICSAGQLPSISNRVTKSFDNVEGIAGAFNPNDTDNQDDIYHRLTSEAVRYLEDRISMLEGWPFIRKSKLRGEDRQRILDSDIGTIAASSGMGAISLTFLSLLKSGDTMICDEVLYGCTDNLIFQDFEDRGIKVVAVDSSDTQAVRTAFEENTEAKLIYFETPANPTLKITDIKEVSDIARKYNALSVVDNTFMSPNLQSPLALGADISVNSTTKYLNGHSDRIGGVATGPNAFIAKMWNMRRLYGNVMDDFAAVQTVRGIETLPLRMERHCYNAEKVVKYLLEMKEAGVIKEVYYPDREGSKEIADKQMRRYGGMIAFEINGDIETTRHVINDIPDDNLLPENYHKVGFLAVSLGAKNTLYDCPALMTHSVVPPKNRLKKGITDTLVRMHVGLENPNDIIKTLDAALQYVKPN